MHLFLHTDLADAEWTVTRFYGPFLSLAGWFRPQDVTLKAEEDVTDSFLGEIRMFSFNWAPETWALCNGTILQIAQNQALYSLIGAYYGGDNKTTFALPDLRGRAISGRAPKDKLGTTYGTETVTLTANTAPLHTHLVRAAAAPATAYNVAHGDVLFAEPPAGSNIYAPFSGTPQPINPASVAHTGAGSAHNNMQPYAVVNFCICTQGVYPTRP